MIGRLLPRRRRAAPPAAGAEPSALPPEAGAPVGPAGGEQPTAVLTPAGSAAPLAADAGTVLPPPGADVPAGLELQPPADAPPPVASFRNRGRLRRRLRLLRRVRELGFRDLGGLVFDLDRFGREGRSLVRGKLDALGAVDAELRALERALDDRRDHVDLREPGVSACPRCGALHGSDAHFCPNCGLHLSGPVALADVADARGSAPPAPASDPAAGPGAGSGAPDGGTDTGDGVRAADTGATPVSSGTGPLTPGPDGPTSVRSAAPSAPGDVERPPRS